MFKINRIEPTCVQLEFPNEQSNQWGRTNIYSYMSKISNFIEIK